MKVKFNFNVNNACESELVSDFQERLWMDWRRNRPGFLCGSVSPETGEISKIWVHARDWGEPSPNHTILMDLEGYYPLSEFAFRDRSGENLFSSDDPEKRREAHYLLWEALEKIEGLEL